MTRVLQLLLLTLAGAAALALACSSGGVARLPAVPPGDQRALRAAAEATPQPPGLAWAAVAHQRTDVFELTREQLRLVLTGRVDDWAALGGSARPLHVYLERRDAAAVAAAIGVSAEALHATMLDDATLAAQVAAAPGAFGVIRVDELEPGVLGLIVDGIDPYRDPASVAPLRSPGTPPDVDPVLLVSPAELLPVRCANAALEAAGDFDVIFDAVRPLTRSADVAVIALDAGLTDLGRPTPCVSTFTLQGSSRSVAPIADAGIDVVFANGNHMLDCWEGCSGTAVLLDTLARLRASGVRTVGAGADLDEARRAEVVAAGHGADQVRVAFLAYDEIAPWNWATAGTPGTAPLSEDHLRADVAAAKADADVVVVATSWGVEYESVPTASQRALARAAIEAGATLVIGNHPHTVQAVETLPGSLVTYALGNFLFDQSWSVPTTESVLLEASFIRGRLAGYRLRPMRTAPLAGQTRGLYRPLLLDPAKEGLPILRRVWDASDALR